MAVNAMQWMVWSLFEPVPDRWQAQTTARESTADENALRAAKALRAFLPAEGELSIKQVSEAWSVSAKTALNMAHNADHFRTINLRDDGRRFWLSRR